MTPTQYDHPSQPEYLPWPDITLQLCGLRNYPKCNANALPTDSKYYPLALQDGGISEFPSYAPAAHGVS